MAVFVDVIGCLFRTTKVIQYWLFLSLYATKQ